MTNSHELTHLLDQIKVDGSPSQVKITDSWLNGRTAFGGLSVALGVRAMAGFVDPDRALRSLLVSFIGPVPEGVVQVLPSQLRKGGSVTQTAADIVAEDSVRTRIMASYGAPRPEREAPSRYVLDAPNPQTLQRAPFMQGHMPSFLQNIDSRWLGDGIPASGQKSYRLRMWVRHLSDTGSIPVERLVMIADIPPPIMLSHYRGMTRASSLSWSLDVTRDPRAIATDWFFLDYDLHQATNGYSYQTGKIFSEDGHLCAVSSQCMVYFDRKKPPTSQDDQSSAAATG